jgi:hypothetical protein
MKTKPNLFIIGAPKSGTTTLAKWLESHPDIFFSQVKEPAFFCGFGETKWQGPGADEFIRAIVTDKSEYEALFTNGARSKWRAEASTDYLWSPLAAERIANECGTTDVRCIVVLRDPVQRAFSEHAHLIRDGYEELSFLKSLEKEEERFEQNWQPLFYHRRRGLYAEEITRYFEIFGRERIKVISYSDLSRDPKTVADDIFEFLDIEPIDIATNERHNQSGMPRSRFLHNLIIKPTLAKNIIKHLLPDRYIKKARLILEGANLSGLRITQIEKEHTSKIFKEDITNTAFILKEKMAPSKVEVCTNAK